MEYKTKGIDISEESGKYINFKELKNQGFEFVIIRAGYGGELFDEDHEDSNFENNYLMAKAAGFKIGAYFSSTARSLKRAKREANSFIDIVKDKEFDYPLFYFLQEKLQLMKGLSFISGIVSIFAGEMKNAGFIPGVFVPQDYVTRVLTDNIRNTLPIWVAQYDHSPNHYELNDLGQICQYKRSIPIDEIDCCLNLDYSSF